MRPAVLRRFAAGVAGLVVFGATSACGGEDSSANEESPSSSESVFEAADGEYPFDLSDLGEDLLDDARRGVVITATDTEVSWRFHETYDSTSQQKASSKNADDKFDITVGAKPDADPQSEAENITSGAGPDGEVYEVMVGDRPFLHSPEGESSTYAVLFATSAPLGDTPEERLDELHQMVAPLDFEPAGS